MKNKNIVLKNDRLVSVYFESILDLMDYVPSGENADVFRKFMNRSQRNYSNWLGSTNENVGDVIDHALTGDKALYESLMKKVNRMNKTIDMSNVNSKQRIESVKRKLKFDRFGDELDIHKVYAGKLESAWSRRERVVVDKKHSLITLFINIGGLALVDADDSLWRSVVVLKVFGELQKAGKSVRILVGGTSSAAFQRVGHSCSCAVVVKEYNQSLSVERLAAMSHVGFHRVFGFAAKSAQNEYKLSGGMGATIKIGDHNVPINLQEEVKDGHTKIVYIDKSTRESDAFRDLEKVYSQLKSLSGE